MLPHEVDDRTKRKELLERTRRELQTTAAPLEALKMIDTLQRLGLAYHFEDDINSLLKGFSDGQSGEDLLTAALRFRLLRHNGHKISPGINSIF